MSFPFFSNCNPVERREDLVKVDGLSFEDSLPLGRRYVFWGSWSDADEELNLFNVFIEELEEFDRLPHASVIILNGSWFSSSMPGHIGLCDSRFLFWPVGFRI